MYTYALTALCLIVSLPSCCSISKDEQIAMRLLNSFARKEQIEKKWFTIGLGGSMPDKINALTIHFISKESVRLNEARKLYVECTQELLTKVNDDIDIRPYLLNFPFKSDNLDVMLSFQDQSGNEVENPFIASVFMAKGNICYSIFNPETQLLNTIHREPYEEALKIVRDK